MLKFIICIKNPSCDLVNQLIQLHASSSTSFSQVKHLQYCQYETDIEDALALKISNTSHPQDLFVSFWYASHTIPSDLMVLLEQHSIGFQEYLCLENRPLTVDVIQPGRQNHFHQVALIKRPKTLTQQTWLDIWLNSHTQIAIDTQSSFLYTQNICTAIKARGEWPLMDAIVEEGFPMEAAHDREIFFNAKDKPELKAEREQTMVHSCLRFIDFENFDCLPTQQTII